MNKTFVFFDSEVFKGFETSSWCILAETAKDGSYTENGAVVANADGLPFVGIVFSGGDFGKKLEAKGPKAQNEFAMKKLAEVVGEAAVRNHVVASYSTRWMEWNGGAYSFAKAGCADAHLKLAAKLRDESGLGRVYFVGEACEDPQSGWGGSYAGAYVSGIRGGNEAVRDDAAEQRAKNTN
jgi:hypothetical protein